MLKKYSCFILFFVLILNLLLSCAQPGSGGGDDGSSDSNASKVIYNGNTNTGGSVPVDSANYYTGSAVIIADNTGNLEKTGFTFAGWNTQADGNGTNYAQGETVFINGNSITLYAVWTVNSIYKVLYNGNGSTGGTVPIDNNFYNSSLDATVKGNTGNLINPGFSFAGWNTQADCNGKTYTQGQKFRMGDEDITLYAVWTLKPTFNVIYHADTSTGGDIPIDNTNYVENISFTVAGNPGSLIKPGYILEGWNTQSDGYGNTYTEGQTITMRTSDIHLYAKWKRVYTVTYYDNGSTGGSVPVDNNFYDPFTRAVAKGNPGNLVKPGYRFYGWNTKEDGMGITFFENDNIYMHDDQSLYAVWKLIPTFSVIYRVGFCDSGTVPVDNNKYEKDASVTVLGNPGNLVRSNYALTGWNTRSDGRGTTYKEGDSITMGNEDINLYALWEDDVKLLYVKGTSTGGDVPYPRTGYAKNTEIILPDNIGNLVRTGYYFNGWLYGNTIPMAPGYKFTITSDTTMYPDFRINPSVTYDSNGSESGSVPSSVEQYEPGTAVTVNENTGSLYKSGYNFAGWCTNSDGTGIVYQGGNSFTMGKDNITLYAKWNEVAVSDNNLLSGLSISDGVLSPEFNSGINTYNAAVINSVASIRITPVKQDSFASIKVRINSGVYSNLVSGATSGSLNLNVGNNLIEILITAQNGSDNKYSLTVTREASDNNLLSGLSFQSGTLSPDFNSAVNTYTSTVSHSIKSLKITPSKQDPDAVIKVRINNGNYSDIESGTSSDSLDLNVGDNIIDILVTAQNSTVNKYTLTVNRNILHYPSDISVSSDDTEKVSLNWTASEGAEKYYIYRSVSENGTYSEIGNTANTYYNDSTASSAVNYYYKLKAWTAESGLSDFSSACHGYAALDAPVGLSAANGIYKDKISLSWNSVSAAEKYEIYRSENDSSYTLISTVTVAEYTDSDTYSPGKKYYYKVKACKNNGIKSVFSVSDFGYRDLEDPVNIEASDNYASKIIKITWPQIFGATRYDILRLNSHTGSYDVIATAPYNKFEYEDKTPKFETTYYYKVRAYSSSADIYSDLSNEDSGFCYFSSPFNGNVSSDDSKITITWIPVSGVTKYYISRSTSQYGTFTELGSTTTDTFEDNTAVTGTAYYYRVASWDSILDKDDTPWASPVVYRLFSSPNNIGASQGYLNKIVVKWDSVDNATHYRVYRSTSATGSYSYWATTTDTVYTDSTSNSYYYKITATKNHNAESVLSNYYGSGWPGSIINAPLNVNATRGIYTNKIEITWDDEPQATNGYEVYRSYTLNGSYSRIGGTTGTSYTDQYTGSKKTFYYKIRSSDGVNKSGYSIYAIGSTN